MLSPEDASRPATSIPALITRKRLVEFARILLVALIALLYWRGVLPLPVLLAGVAIGLYPLVKTGVLDLARERKVGTEIFVSVATVIAILGRE